MIILIDGEDRSMKMRCIYMIVILLVTLGISEAEKETWEKYQIAYNVDKVSSIYNYTITYVSHDLFGTFSNNGQNVRLQAIGTTMLLLTKDSKPVWFKTPSIITIYHFFQGDPLKFSNLNADGTITVQYLGNKLHPLCRNLNCQHELVYKFDDVIKKDLVDPNGFSLILGILAPFPNDGEKKITFTPDTNLRSRLKG